MFMLDTCNNVERSMSVPKIIPPNTNTASLLYWHHYRLPRSLLNRNGILALNLALQRLGDHFGLGVNVQLLVNISDMGPYRINGYVVTVGDHLVA